MKFVSFILALLFSINASASGLQASWGGSNLSGLTRTTTVFESRGDIDVSGNLIDHSGGGHHLTPSATPSTTGVSNFQGSDGRLIQSRVFDGVNNYYSTATVPAFDVYTGDVTITAIVMHSTSAASTDYIFSNGVLSSDGCQMYSGGANVSTIFSKAGAYAGPQVAVNLRDGYYHVIQTVKRGTSAFLYVDGVISPVATVDATYGLTPTSNFIIGDRSDLARKWQGAVLYFRLDAEAITAERLAYERDYLRGLAVGVGTAPIGWDFSRASVATYEYSTKGISYSAPQNTPRVSGDGGGALIEAAGTQRLTYTGAFSTNWTKTNSSIAVTSVVLPDGTTGTTNVLHEDGTAAASHAMSHTFSVTSGTTYCFSMYTKYNSAAGTPRRWVRMYIDDGIDVKTVYIDVASGIIGTTGGALAGSYGVSMFGDGWYRPYICAAATHTSGGAAIIFSVAEADGDVTFNGANQDSVFIFGPQVESGAHVTSYIPSPTTSTTRSADSLTLIPYKLSSDLRVPGAAEKLYVSFQSQDPLSSTLVDNTSTYTFTKSGTVAALDDYVYGRRFVFNGTDSQYVLADAGTLAPTGSFSVVAVVTPDALPTAGNYMYVFGKYTTTGDKRSWALYYTDAGTWTFAVSKDGDSPTTSFVQKSNAVQVGRTQIVVATLSYSGTPGNTSTANLYVDDLTVSTDAAFYAPAKSNDANVNIGRSGGGSRFQGKIHWVALYDGTAVSASQVTALYSKFKQANVLPLGLGTGYIGNALTIEFDAKCAFTSATDMGADRNLFSIGANYFTGTSPQGATTTKNNLSVYAKSSDGRVYSDLYTGSSTTRRYMYSAVGTTYNQWHTYKVYVNFADLTTSNIWVDSAAGTLDATMTGARDFDFRDTYIRIGQPVNNAANTVYAAPDAQCSFRNLRVVPAQF